MTTRDFLLSISRPGHGIKRWIIVIFAGSLIVFFGILVIDWLSNGNQITSWLSTAFSRIHENPNLQSWLLPIIGWASIGSGLFMIIYSSSQMSVAVMRFLASPQTKRHNPKLLKIVVFGGGSGIFPVLQALKTLDVEVTAVVTVADSGGSTGKLREEMLILAPGDIRRCMIALSDQPLFDKLMRYRFTGSGSLDGHSLGNLMIAAMTMTEGDFTEAVFRMSKMLATKGTVIPFTIDSVSICAKYEDGTIVQGEAEIPKAGKPIKKVFFNPPYAKPYVRVLEAVDEADVIIVGPGSLYTSIMPCLLLAPIVDTISNSKARKIYISNLMTEPGETTNYSVEDHLDAIKNHTGCDLFDTILVNNGFIDEETLEKYKSKNSLKVTYTQERIKAKVVEEDLVEIEDNFVRHSKTKLSRILSRFIRRNVDA
jgi:uncharacterized cofD-like protein